MTINCLSESLLVVGGWKLIHQTIPEMEQHDAWAGAAVREDEVETVLEVGLESLPLPLLSASGRGNLSWPGKRNITQLSCMCIYTMI